MIKVVIKNSSEAVSLLAAEIIDQSVRKKPNITLGLPTGATPKRAYELLVKYHKSKLTNWSQVVTFNLDEYVGVNPNSSSAYHFYMRKFLFKGVNILPSNTHLPSGKENKKKSSQDYENKILKAGGIDLQLLGLGVNAHIGFNEPGTAVTSRTRVVTLKHQTIKSNRKYFPKFQKMPKQAITVGITTILAARKIILLAYGKKKAQAVHDALLKKPSSDAPASFLQTHKNVTFIIDEAAACLLRTKGFLKQKFFLKSYKYS